MGILGYVTGKSKQSWHLHIKAGAVNSKNQGGKGKAAIYTLLWLISVHNVLFRSKKKVISKQILVSEEV